MLSQSSSCSTIPCGVIGSNDDTLRYDMTKSILVWMASIKTNGFYAAMIANGGYDYASLPIDYVHQRPVLQKTSNYLNKDFDIVCDAEVYLLFSMDLLLSYFLCVIL